jgi:polyhydroxybutyrate depolymerase
MRSTAFYLLLTGLLVVASCAKDTPGTSSSSDTGTRDTIATDASADTDVAADIDAADDTAAHPDTSDTTGDLGTDTGPDAPTDTTLGPDERPAELLLPNDYAPDGQYPLFVVLHGYGMSGDGVDTYLEFSKLRHDRQFMMAAPDGIRDTTGQRYWNATDYCCDYYEGAPDDATYLINLVDEATARFAVAPDRIFFVGFSAGGFMAYRMACDYPDQIAGIASISGSSFDDAEACAATEGGPRILHVHGTGDTVVGYYGTLAYPGARTVVERWAARNDCDEDAADVGRADLDINVIGDETWMREWTGCAGDRRVGLWSLQGGLHFPGLRDAFTPAVVEFLTR